MTGSGADADDLVQETFARALEHPPPDRSRSLRPWLLKVAMNLARDQLRKRRRRAYPGQWLPEPVELADELLSASEPASNSPERRYSTLESLSFAFLRALEALTPAQRAVLLLRDAMDVSVRETGELLDMSEANVKVTLHRARKAMASYERVRQPPSEEVRERVNRVLSHLLVAMATGDLAAVESLLSDGAVAISDGGGLTTAAGKPVLGKSKIARMYVKLASKASPAGRAELKQINGAPAVVGADPDVGRPAARRYVLRIELDEHGLIREIHSVLSPLKLASLFPL